MLVEKHVLCFTEKKYLGKFITENNVGDVMVDMQALSITGEFSRYLTDLAYIRYNASVETSLSVTA